MQHLRRLIGRRSARRDHGVCVVEGEVLLAEARAAGWHIDAVYVDGASIDDRPPPDVPPGTATHVLAKGVAGRVSAMETAPGVFAVVRSPPARPAPLADRPFLLVADRVADPGNLGTIFRSAEAAGADAVVVTPGTVDHTNPKVVRASAGAVFHLPVIAATIADLGATHRRIGTSSHRGVAHGEADWTGSIAIVVGNEAAGLAVGGEPEIDEWVRIAHHGRAESLNVAMAATVLCFEAARHRTR